jgi:tetrahydromethanopterin S-methyltransferase subunit H
MASLLKGLVDKNSIFYSTFEIVYSQKEGILNKECAESKEKKRRDASN